MGQRPAPVEGVYERVVESGNWYARYYVNNKQVRKSFGRDRAAAVRWVEEARTVKHSGKGFLPLSAKLAIKTADDLAADQAAAALAASQNGALLGELCDGLLKEIPGRPRQRPPYSTPQDRSDKTGDGQPDRGQRPRLGKWPTGLMASAARPSTRKGRRGSKPPG